MVFTTHLFLFYFLPATLLLYYTLPRRWRTGFIGIISVLFYAWANPWWALVMMFSTTVDYICGRVLAVQARLPLAPDGDYEGIPADMPRTRGMKLTMWASVLSNLLFLFYFKYAEFTTENLQALAVRLGLGPDSIPILRVVLPIGISFYTFQSMSYCIDIYRGDARPMRRILNFFAFETLYPQLVAGPIVRYQEISEQLIHRTHTLDKFARGIAFFALGMAKKILLANPMGHIADRAFEAATLHWYDAWFGITAYVLLIDSDYSG
jgi:alginate O-acetyltransferase complex protein AlgI